ncbi:MAG: hypothetical protein A2Y86_03545 [Candidatus Aminicenantes bacterium RBG_13_62_12]|nr:MAG: hypothetical protein A2Y86_03545 [Candidatus Aminicenantes bacterium RBG_13_62_12]
MRAFLALSLVLSLAAAAFSRADEPQRITVQHILIAFKGSLPDASVTRTQKEAETLVKELMERIKKGEDFDALVKGYTNDQHPGIYSMSNIGVTPDQSKPEYPRDRMVKGFGDVGFSLKVGEVGVAGYDPKTSPYGWHIIKRLK